jgi:hypothetical protein
MENYCVLHNNATYAGGMLLLQSNVTVRHNNNSNTMPLLVENNKAIQDGGYIWSLNSIITIMDCNLHQNQALNGGGMILKNTTLRLFGNNNSNNTNHIPNIIQNNIADEWGGFLYAEYSKISIDNYYIQQNQAIEGGAMFLNHSILSLHNSMDNPIIIQENVANYNGGFICSIDAIISIVGVYHFQYNQAERGGVFFMDNTNLTLHGNNINRDSNKNTENNYNMPTIQRTIFDHNIVSLAGGVLFANHSNILIDSNYYTISHNEAEVGGAFCILNTSLSLLGNTDRTRPIVETSEGSFAMKHNRANSLSGIIYADSSILFLEQCNMDNNMAQAGAVIYISNTSLILSGHKDTTIPTIIENNIATKAGIIYSSNDANIQMLKGRLLFYNNFIQVCKG